MTDTDPTKAVPKLLGYRSLVAWTLIPLFDVLLLVGGAISVMTAGWQILVRLPWALLTRDRDWRRLRLRRCGIYAAVALLTFVATRIDEHITEDRAEAVVHAIKQFHAEQGRYPETMDELVPKHLAAIPVARPFALSQNHFRYRHVAGASGSKPRPPSLFYTRVAPFGWMSYDFEANEWRFRD